MPHLHLPAGLLEVRPAVRPRRRLPALPAALLALLSLLVGPGAWATDITSCPYRITMPGVYHVTQDLSCASASMPAIQVLTDNVTLSLDGHTITGPGGMVSQAVAIDVVGDRAVSISNGAISSFGAAVELESETSDSSVSGLTVTRCTTGVSVDRGATSSVVMGNSCTGLEVGILISGGEDNLISDNTCNNNKTGIAVDSGSGNTIRGNTALGNSTVDLQDSMERCDEDVWSDNCFMTESQPCIGTSICGTPPPSPSPPGINCPGNKTVTAALGQNSATVMVGMATSSTQGATIVGVRSDGKALTAPYPLGATTITWMATVDGQMPVTCTETITVQPISFPFIIRGPSEADPHTDSIFVERGPVFQEAIIHGHGFADVQGASYVTLGGQQVPVLDWTDDAIAVVIYPTAWNQPALGLNAAYPVQVVIPANGSKSNTVDFFLTDGPPALG